MKNLINIIERGSPDLHRYEEPVPDNLQLFTPTTDDSGVRLRLFVEPGSYNLPRGRGHTATVIDAPTGLRFDVASAPCELNCYCAARVVAIHFD